MNWSSKLINDTLKNKDGIWSRKSLTIFVTFVFVLVLGTFIVISDKILDKEVNRYSIEVFNSLLLFEMSLLGLTEISKKFLNKQLPPEE